MSGIGPKRAEALAARGISTVEDLLFHLPSKYQDWRERRQSTHSEAGIVCVAEGTGVRMSASVRCRGRDGVVS